MTCNKGPRLELKDGHCGYLLGHRTPQLSIIFSINRLFYLNVTSDQPPHIFIFK